MTRPRLASVVRAGLAVLALAVALGCASAPKGERGLTQVVQEYNNAIRWKRPDRAQPYVESDKVRTFADWADGYGDDFDIQEWKVREIRYVSDVTAEVEIERTGFEVRKLIQRDMRITQTWVQDDDDLWRLREGF